MGSPVVATAGATTSWYAESSSRGLALLQDQERPSAPHLPTVCVTTPGQWAGAGFLPGSCPWERRALKLGWSSLSQPLSCPGNRQSCVGRGSLSVLGHMGIRAFHVWWTPTQRRLFWLQGAVGAFPVDCASCWIGLGKLLFSFVFLFLLA